MITILRADGSSLTPDACITEDYTPAATLTQSAIEDGSIVSDHLQNAVWRYTATVVITETPLESAGLAQQSGVERVQAARKFLLACMGLAAPGRRGPRGDLRCLIGTIKFGALDGMVLVACPHQVNGENSITVDLVFEQIVIARGVSVKIPVNRPRSDKQVSLPSKQNIGAQGTKNVPLTDAAGAEDRSTLLDYGVGLGIFDG